MTEDHTKDRRVQKTERLLRDALVSLIHEKSYDSIAVKEILDRANVGRSAFYAHFHDKDALLASGIHQMLHEGSPRRLPPGAERFRNVVWFSLPVFEYVNSFRHTAGGGLSAEVRFRHGRQTTSSSRWPFPRLRRLPRALRRGTVDSG